MTQVSPYPHYIGGRWCEGSGEDFRSVDPATGETVWQGPAAAAPDVQCAIDAAREAFGEWSQFATQRRENQLRAYAEELEKNKETLAALISNEVGKPTWEALTEVQAMIGKVEISIDAYAKRCAELAAGNAVTRFKPHGVVAVFGPFNFPGHLPNGHIVPALLAGNTVVLKPSEHAPSVAQRMVETWVAAGLPDGVLNLMQGGQTTGAALAENLDIDGIFFTGSARTGIRLNEHLARRPDKILALEMGGNNPLLVHDVSDLQAAAYLTVQSAYLSAGQRCTCARRLIVPRGGEGDRFVQTLRELIPRIRVGPPSDRPEPFMGPVISTSAAQAVFEAQQQLVERGGEALVRLGVLKPGTGLVTPGLIDVTEVENRTDEEIFGPLLQLIRVHDFDAAIEEANQTAFGLSAGLLSDDALAYRAFYRGVRAGIVNWNQQLTGASSAAPFGGVGLSGNHRPSAYFAADYSAYPVASIEMPEIKLPAELSPGLELS